jgi:hypothetical protein
VTAEDPSDPRSQGLVGNVGGREVSGEYRALIGGKGDRVSVVAEALGADDGRRPATRRLAQLGRALRAGGGSAADAGSAARAMMNDTSAPVTSSEA